MEQIERIFGKAGVLLGSISSGILKQAPNIRYRFIDKEKFARLPLAERMNTYWTEILNRSHWAAYSNLLRQERWFKACVLLHEYHNFLGFCGALRSYLEGSADAHWSFRIVPRTIARARCHIQLGIAGKATKRVISRELEDALIHFQFARKLTKGDQAPASHKAQHMSEYIAAADGPTSKSQADLYARLCELAHPAAPSLHWATRQYGEYVSIVTGQDVTLIEDLCGEHAAGIESALMLSINTCIVMLKLLNRFPLEYLHSPAVDGICMDRVPLWNKVELDWAAAIGSQS